MGPAEKPAAYFLPPPHVAVQEVCQAIFFKETPKLAACHPRAIVGSSYARIIDLSKVFSSANVCDKKKASDARPAQAYSTMAMMASGPAGNPYDQNDTIIEQDLLEDGKALHVLLPLWMELD